MPAVTAREEILGAGGLMLAAGGWLIVSPFVLSYKAADAVWSPVLVGALIVLLTLARMTSGLWASWISWLNFAFGAWLVTSPLWLAESTAARWNALAAGSMVIVLALLSGGATESARRRAGERA